MPILESMLLDAALFGKTGHSVLRINGIKKKYKIITNVTYTFICEIEDNNNINCNKNKVIKNNTCNTAVFVL